MIYSLLMNKLLRVFLFVFLCFCSLIDVIFVMYFPQTYPLECAATNGDLHQGRCWSQAPKTTDRCQLGLVKLGSDFSPSYLESLSLLNSKI